MNAIKDLAKRVLPNHWEQISFEPIEAAGEKDVYEVNTLEGKLVIRGNNFISMAAGLGWYLKETANCNLSWCGSRLELPPLLPPVAECSRKVIEQKYRVYMNYCTFNYSASWWKWDRWEKEIDFMALNGINMPLSVVGIEGVWRETLTEFGFTDEEARQFLCGPAFLAWQWMTNIEGFCGPLPAAWIESHVNLGQKIIERERSLGMQPIQQGFSGFVPLLLKEKYPDANILKKEEWFGLPATAQLDPTDPLFDKLGALFLQKQRELFGTNGFYAIDPFHESEPPLNTTEYLEAVGDSVKNLLTSFDPEGVWVAQSWSIRHDIVSRMDKKHLLILDLCGEKHTETDNFWGYPFVTGTLHNFGGRTNLHGDLKMLAENPYKTVEKIAPNVCGAGLFMESIGQNPAYYDLAFTQLTGGQSLDLQEWMDKYMLRRTGVDSEKVRKAGEILLKTVYAPGTNGVEKSSIVAARPAVRVKKSGPNDGFHYPYGNRRLFSALKLLMSAGVNSDGARYDVVDILRQVLSNYGQNLYAKAADAFLNRDAKAFQTESESFLELLSDMDMLLSSRYEFRLDQWIGNARSWGETMEEKQYYEWNASTLLTLWGTPEGTHIFDYAWKEWSGMIELFYKQRWSKFFEMLAGCLEKDEEYVEDGLPQVFDRQAWRANEFYNALADWETAWTTETKSFSASKPDELEIVSTLIAKYEDRI